MAISIRGMDGFTRSLEEVQKATKALEPPIKLSVDPDNPEIAVREMEAEVDRRLSPYRSNDTVLSLGNQFKAKSKQQILQQAADARNKGIRHAASREANPRRHTNPHFPD